MLSDVDHLLASKTWEAAADFALDDTVRVVIATQAALLVLGLSLEQYRGASGIIVHPTTLHTRGERPGPSAGTVSADRLAVVGLAQSGHGPVVLAWDQALAGADRALPGENVVLHEFPHKLDMLDGVIDGTSVLDRDLRDEWVRVCTDVYDDLVADVPRPPMRWYGATNPGEFFAVATQAFFEQPREVAQGGRCFAGRASAGPMSPAGATRASRSRHFDLCATAGSAAETPRRLRPRRSHRALRSASR